MAAFCVNPFWQHCHACTLPLISLSNTFFQLCVPNASKNSHIIAASTLHHLVCLILFFFKYIYRYPFPLYHTMIPSTINCLCLQKKHQTKYQSLSLSLVSLSSPHNALYKRYYYPPLRPLLYHPRYRRYLGDSPQPYCFKRYREALPPPPPHYLSTTTGRHDI